jgi:ubiquinone/menaquinone biosynthesis C-methylase UbiE
MSMSNFTALNPEGYQKIMGRFSRQLARSFIEFTGSSAGEKILDVGCGTGSMTAALAQRGDHTAIVGIDVSESYVAFARAHNSDPRVTFDIGDASSLPYPSGHFDRAVSQLVLQFLPDPYPAVAEMRRAVRAGGIVAACTWDSFGGRLTFGCCGTPRRPSALTGLVACSAPLAQRARWKPCGARPVWSK